MGIPHLITYLRPYADVQSLAGQDLIVDGPGLCYHIHRRCLGQRGDARNAFEAAPSYEELGQATFEWLDGLQKSGAVVQKIYFDGFLPPAKLKTRLERLQKQTKQLMDYQKTHTTPCRATLESYKTAPQSMFDGRSPRPALTSVPPPPFLVPAILEALQSSQDYKYMTEVVPGEADLYCARYTKSHGGTILTGDSDLLVHDLGSDGAVSFFTDIQLSSVEQPGYLHTLIYQSAAIAERLGLQKPHKMLSLAFEMFMDNHGTFPKLLSQATSFKAIKMWGGIYEDFCKEYRSGTGENEGGIPAPNTFQNLDPRISEIVLQFPDLAKLAGQDVAARSPNQDTPHAFLPFLLDCSARTSAWEISTSVRQLAYGLINLIVPSHQQRFSVIEHRRQQKIASCREWQLPSLSEIPDACMAIAHHLTQLKELRVPEAEMWLAAMICNELEWSTSLDKLPLSQSVVDQLFDIGKSTNTNGNCTWDIIHFNAQIQGSYYSFRILKQIIGVLMAQDEAHLLPGGIGQLSSLLESLPGFCDVPDLRDVASLYGRIEKNGLLKIARKIVGIEEPTSVVKDEVSSKASQKKRKRKNTGNTKGPPTTKNKPRNLFALLDVE